MMKNSNNELSNSKLETAFENEDYSFIFNNLKDKTHNSVSVHFVGDDINNEHPYAIDLSKAIKDLKQDFIIKIGNNKNTNDKKIVYSTFLGKLWQSKLIVCNDNGFTYEQTLYICEGNATIMHKAEIYNPTTYYLVFRPLLPFE